jgi:hypothetical protein
MNIVLTHDARLLISKREELASMFISDALESVVGLFNHIKSETALDEQGSDNDGHVGKFCTHLFDQRAVGISIALSKTLLLEIVGSHVNVHSLDVRLMLLEKADKTLIHAILNIQDLVAANTEVENTRVLVDAQYSSRGLEALNTAGIRNSGGVLARVTLDLGNVGVVVGLMRSKLEHLVGGFGAHEFTGCFESLKEAVAENSDGVVAGMTLDLGDVSVVMGLVRSLLEHVDRFSDGRDVYSWRSDEQMETRVSTFCIPVNKNSISEIHQMRLFQRVKVIPAEGVIR